MYTITASLRCKSLWLAVPVYRGRQGRLDRVRSRHRRAEGLRQERPSLKQATNASVRPRSERCEANSSTITCTVTGRAICEKAFGPALSVSTKLSPAITVPQSGAPLLTACSRTAEADSSATRRHPRPRSPSEKARRLRRAILFPGRSRPPPPRPDLQSRRRSGIPPEPF